MRQSFHRHVAFAALLSVLAQSPAFAAPTPDSHAIPADSDGSDEDMPTGKSTLDPNLFPPVSKLGSPPANSDYGVTPQQRMGRDRDNGNDNRPLLP